jgi:hypothetical protein
MDDVTRDSLFDAVRCGRMTLSVRKTWRGCAVFRATRTANDRFLAVHWRWQAVAERTSIAGRRRTAVPVIPTTARVASPIADDLIGLLL